MGNTSSSANTANTRTQQAPQARPQIHTTTSDHRTAPTADYSEDWLDSEAANRNSPYGYIPEEFFQSLDEDSSEESFLDGIDIDEILSEDSVGPAAAAMPPRRNANHNSYVDLTNDASPPGQSSRSPRQPISLKRSAEGSSQGRSKKRTKRTAEDKANIEELDLTNEAPSAEEELLQNQQKEAIKAQQASDDNDPSGPLKIGKRQCIICMENFTNATITSCGHIYCHECLTQALIAGEKNSDRGVGNCPVCRKPVQRKKDKQVIPIAFMKKSAFKGKARRDMSVLGFSPSTTTPTPDSVASHLIWILLSSASQGPQYSDLYAVSVDRLVKSLVTEKGVYSVTRLNNTSPGCTLSGSTATSAKLSPASLLVGVDWEVFRATVGKLRALFEFGDLVKDPVSGRRILHWSMSTYSLSQFYEPRRARDVEGKCTVAVAIEPSVGQDADVDAWYRKEHLAMLATSPLFLRCRRYTRILDPSTVDQNDSAGEAKFLAVHDYSSVQDLFDHSLAKGPLIEETEWTKRVFDQAKSVERTIWTVQELMPRSPG
ncbi:hypothetical protein LTR37_020797 [Vermiconidia calcicola]|uniref:Uncharacterized protein n=1 Tax=Vermiconidia calcicola TaxID=1690605 RepID=A0ACC3MAE8_9PEZI|nr:hypothetical protein LTR37_020797 [Vermiconidia calcicola]